MQKAANSSIVPSRPRGTWASSLARTAGSVAPVASRKPGKSMKFVPTALTCTPWRATSPATLRASIVAPARAAE